MSDSIEDPENWKSMCEHFAEALKVDDETPAGTLHRKKVDELVKSAGEIMNIEMVRRISKGEDPEHLKNILTDILGKTLGFGKTEEENNK